MSAVFETFTTELRALVASVWTDTPADGIWENEDLQMMAWDQITPPVANMVIPMMPISRDWGPANVVHEGSISLYWIGPTSGDGSNQRANAEAMRDALLAATFSVACVLDVDSVDWSDKVPINATFLEKAYPQRACVVAASVLVTAKAAS